MDQNEYPRPDAIVGGVYPKDKTWGIVIIVLSALGVCGSVALGGLGAAVGAGGASAALAGANNTADGRAAAATLGAAGGGLAFIAFLLAGICVLQLIGGVGIMKSLKWGFLVVGGLAALSALINVVHFNIIGLAINGVFIYYAYMRLSGKMGPVPA